METKRIKIVVMAGRTPDGRIHFHAQAPLLSESSVDTAKSARRSFPCGWAVTPAYYVEVDVPLDFPGPTRLEASEPVKITDA